MLLSPFPAAYSGSAQCTLYPKSLHPSHSQVLAAVHRYYSAIYDIGTGSDAEECGPHQACCPPSATATLPAPLPRRRCGAEWSKGWPNALVIDSLTSKRAIHSQMHLAEFLKFCDDSYVPDEHSKYCKRSQLASIFLGANQKARALRLWRLG